MSIKAGLEESLLATEAHNLPPSSTLVDVHKWVQPSHCYQDQLLLRHGQLLRWMDVAACLSAERHAKVPCVTVSVDDITFDSIVQVGNIVILSAIVNRAFTSSMEVGIVVRSEDPFTGQRKHVCKAYSVFVAKPEDGSKIKLSPLTPQTEEENREYLLAAERRTMRISHAKEIVELVHSLGRLSTAETKLVQLQSTKGAGRRIVRVSETQVKTIEIVLPIHANHHHTTFGGQIMEWMTDIATISAHRLCHSQLTLETIDSVYFRAPSHMGERIQLQSTVNKLFATRRFEVGVRVEGYAVGEKSRHINSAFFIFRPTDSTFPLPELVADTKIEQQRAARALARHRLSLDRRAIQFEERKVTLTKENSYDLVLKNTSRLMTNFSLTNWEVLQSSPGFEYCKHESKDTLILRIRDTLKGVTAAEAFAKLINHQARTKWDFMCKHCRSFMNITEHDEVLHLCMRSPEPDRRPRDFVLLGSKRVELANNFSLHMIAFSSVETTDMPPLMDYERAQVISSGYIFQDSCLDDCTCHLTYLHQIGSSVMPFVAKDLIGVSGFAEKLYAGLRHYLLQ